MAVLLPLQRELCPFDMAPVTSTALQMVFGDTVAIALMQARLLDCRTTLERRIIQSRQEEPCCPAMFVVTRWIKRPPGVLTIVAPIAQPIDCRTRKEQCCMLASIM